MVYCVFFGPLAIKPWRYSCPPPSPSVLGARVCTDGGETRVQGGIAPLPHRPPWEALVQLQRRGETARLKASARFRRARGPQTAPCLWCAPHGAAEGRGALLWPLNASWGREGATSLLGRGRAAASQPSTSGNKSMGPPRYSASADPFPNLPRSQRVTFPVKQRGGGREGGGGHRALEHTS